MSKVYEKLQESVEFIKSRCSLEPVMGIVLGSGLGDMLNEVKIEAAVGYHEIPGFPVSTVSGHRGRFVFGYLEEVPVVIMQGRVHYYEGYSMESVVLPTRLMAMLGIKILFLTNAAGGIDFDMKAGDLMLITDHISSFVPSPLIGANIEELGIRFPDMSNVYHKELCDIIRKCAKDSGISLREGVYVQFSGPNFETPAEIKMARALGANAVGMSTVCEAMAANHAGVKVCGISLISNLGSGMTDNPLSDDEVKETAQRVGYTFRELMQKSVREMGRLNI